MKSKKKTYAWGEDEDKVLNSLILTKGKNWALISKELYKTYGYKKSGRQCRERWHNHLDPYIIKKQWSVEEEDILFEQHQKYGSKWSQIGEKLIGRSDNSIKNHFYSTVRKILRRINKFIGSKNGTARIRKMKPSTLSMLFSSNDQKFKYQSNKEGSEYTEVKFKEITRKLSDNRQILSTQDISKFSSMLQQMAKVNEVYQRDKNAQAKIKKQKKLQKFFDKVAESQSQSDQQNDSQYFCGNVQRKLMVKKRNCQQPCVQLPINDVKNEEDKNQQYFKQLYLINYQRYLQHHQILSSLLHNQMPITKEQCQNQFVFQRGFPNFLGYQQTKLQEGFNDHIHQQNLQCHLKIKTQGNIPQIKLQNDVFLQHRTQMREDIKDAKLQEI